MRDPSQLPASNVRQERLRVLVRSHEAQLGVLHALERFARARENVRGRWDFDTTHTRSPVFTPARAFVTGMTV